MNVFELTGNVEICDRSNSRAVAYAASSLRDDLRARLGFEQGASGVIDLHIATTDSAFDTHTVEVRAERVVITRRLGPALDNCGHLPASCLGRA